MSLASNSQTLSSTSTECVVPCKALKNALLLKEEYDLKKTQLWIATDSIRYLREIVVKKDELISNKDKEISLMKSNEEAYKGIVKEKDSQISEYKRKYKSAKVQQYAGYGFGVVAVVVGLVLGF
jgi:hypothetical protein